MLRYAYTGTVAGHTVAGVVHIPRTKHSIRVRFEAMRRFVFGVALKKHGKPGKADRFLTAAENNNNLRFRKV